ncbi:hypothetical protein ACT2FY_32280 [Paraburkholderia fungorum]|uniref:hypothetical protein n=1 Tax=Paraburkholderia fungorum TaxID=134537 RepID=UPI00402B62E6
MTALLKLCHCCHNLLPVGEFGRDRQKRDGLMSYCKGCKADLNAEWFATHQQDILARQRAAYRAKKAVQQGSSS